MFHLAAFQSLGTTQGALVFQNVTAVIDGWLTTNANNRFVIPGAQGGGMSPWRIRLAYAMSTGMSVARIFNAYMRRVLLPSIDPVIAALAVPSLVNVQDFGDFGPQIPVSDEFGVECDNTGVTSQTAFVWLHDGNNNIPMGERFTAQFLATNAGSATQATTAANAWTQCNINFTQSLPPGRYACIGLDVTGTTLLGARLVSVNAGPRPGVLGRGSSAILPSNQFRYGNLGTFLEFVPTGQPLIELFDSAAVTAQFLGQMDLVKIG